MDHFSDRGLPLVYHGFPGDRPILTVENYMKWYALQLVMPDGKVEPLDERRIYHELQSEFLTETLVGDHCWNPSYVMEIAMRLDCELCNESLEMITGRWVRDHRDDKELAWALSEKGRRST